MISELLAYDFMQRAILAVIAISIFSPILGLFLILRRQSLMSDTLSHVSLAGVAGLIVSIGITMDSFIIYFERVRDEVRHGLSLRAAVDEGWVHARKTIIVSDAVNLVAAVVLYVLAVGGVQGFAFTLGVTTVVDLAVIIFFTHPLMVACLAIPFFGQGHRLSGLDPEHLGARSRNVYGSGREKIADNLGKSLARAKREAKREQDASEAKEGDN